MRNVVLALLVAGAVLSFAAGEASVDSRLQGQLKQVFPGAAGFSPKGGSPPHFTAYSDPGSKNVAGFVFWTTELEPLERGHDGPIKMLGGMDIKAILTGVLVVEHHDP